MAGISYQVRRLLSGEAAHAPHDSQLLLLPGPERLIMSGQKQDDRPMHIAHLIEALGSGGAERLLYTNLKHLDPARFKSTVVTVFPHATHWAEPVRRLGVEIVSLNCMSYRDLPSGTARLYSWLRKERPDLLHTHLWAANITGRVAGRMSRVPVISSIHNPDYEPEALNDGAEVSAQKRALARLLDRWTARIGCARMVAVSEYVRRSAGRHLRFPADRIDLLYNPIDTQEFQARRGKREELRAELGLPSETVSLLSVARVSPQKGLLYAIRALPLILERNPAAHLISAGALTDSAWLARLKGEADSLGVTDRVHFLGPRRDVADLLRSCDLFVFPSLYEGLGIALLEAMASGCACVAANTGPVPEVIGHGIDGWLVPPGDERSLGEAVCALLADPARRAAMGAAASLSAQARFDPRVAADDLGKIYCSVAAPNRSRTDRVAASSNVVKGEQ
jgi:glycosyltransferase involved in cell wall biosynthesis